MIGFGNKMKLAMENITEIKAICENKDKRAEGSESPKRMWLEKHDNTTEVMEQMDTIKPLSRFETSPQSQLLASIATTVACVHEFHDKIPNTE